jgi:hypothetical protein
MFINNCQKSGSELVSINLSILKCRIRRNIKYIMHQNMVSKFVSRNGKDNFSQKNCHILRNCLNNFLKIPYKSGVRNEKCHIN